MLREYRVTKDTSKVYKRITRVLGKGKNDAGRRKSRSERISRKSLRTEYLFFFLRSPRARDSETSRRQRDSQLVQCVSMRDTRMHGDVNSWLYVRSAPAEGEGEEEEDEERQTTLEDINHPMATLASAHLWTPNTRAMDVYRCRNTTSVYPTRANEAT